MASRVRPSSSTRARTISGSWAEVAWRSLKLPSMETGQRRGVTSTRPVPTRRTPVFRSTGRQSRNGAQQPHAPQDAPRDSSKSHRSFLSNYTVVIWFYRAVGIGLYYDSAIPSGRIVSQRSWQSIAVPPRKKRCLPGSINPRSSRGDFRLASARPCSEQQSSPEVSRAARDLPDTSSSLSSHFQSPHFSVSLFHFSPVGR